MQAARMKPQGNPPRATLPLLLEALPDAAGPQQLFLPAPWAVVLGAGRRAAARRAPPGAVAALPQRPALPKRPDGERGRGRQCSPHRRAKTTNTAKLPLRLRQGAYSRDLFYDVDVDRLRPRTRADCKDGPRPCPFIGCRFHLAISVDIERGSIKEIFPDLGILSDPEGPGLEQLQQLVGTCALDECDDLDDGSEGVGGLIALYQAAQSGRPLGQTPGMTIAEAGGKMNLSIERTRQLSALAMQEVRVKLRYSE